MSGEVKQEARGEYAKYLIADRIGEAFFGLVPKGEEGLRMANSKGTLRAIEDAEGDTVIFCPDRQTAELLILLINFYIGEHGDPPPEAFLYLSAEERKEIVQRIDSIGSEEESA